MINTLLITLFLLSVEQLSAKQVNMHSASEYDVLTEQNAIALALANNPNLAQIKARYEAMKSIPSQVGTLPDPILTLGAMNFPTDSFDRSQEGMTQLQIGVSQAFPFPGKLSLKEDIAEFEAKAAYYDVAEMRLLLTKNVSNKWWQLFYLDRAIETVDKNQALLKQFIEVAKTKYTTGKGLQQDVLLSQLELSKLINHKIQIVALKATQITQLNILMDITPRSPITLANKLSFNQPHLLAEKKIYQLAIRSRSLLQQQKQLKSTAKYQL